MSTAPRIVQVGIDHRSATVALLGRLGRPTVAESAARARPLGRGVVALVTCHRCELYLEGAVAVRAAAMFAAWLGLAPSVLAELAPCLHLREGDSAARHLLRVAAGLESAVLGEDQILGQVREAYRAACQAGQAGPLLHRLFHSAFRAGRRVRGETGLGAGARSLAGAGVAWLGRALGGLEGRTVAIVGAGEMATDAARRLRNRGVGRLLVSNRGVFRGRALADEVGGEVRPWSWRLGALCESDAAVFAVSAPAPVVPHDWLTLWRRRRGAPVAFVDLGMPRNVESCGRLPDGVEAADLTSLAAELEAVGDRRAGAVDAAERIVEEELAAWLDWAQARRVAPKSEAGVVARAAG